MHGVVALRWNKTGWVCLDRYVTNISVLTGGGQIRVGQMVFRGSSSRLDLTFVPFVDCGRAWDEHGPGHEEADTLVSVGAGIQFRFYEALKGEFYYGARLTGVSGDNGDGIQRKGLHFRIVLDTLTPWR